MRRTATFLALLLVTGSVGCGNGGRVTGPTLGGTDAWIQTSGPAVDTSAASR